MTNSDYAPHIFNDDEVPAAVAELFSFPALIAGMKAFLPAELSELILSRKDSVKTVFAFQTEIILPILRDIERRSIRTLSAGGWEHLDPGARYLFISNHRDIILDSAFLNTVLYDQGFRTSQIAIGDNLMRHRISELIFKINKSFVVKRSGTPMELYHASTALSAYIRDQILDDRDSVWIAQREGRAKDGDDRTQAGLLKMLSLCNKGDLKSFFKQLQIVPVAISYEYDPCDVMKAGEYLNKLADPEYKKSFQEDVQHMLWGLKGEKGAVHFEFCKPLGAALDVFDELPNPKRQLEALAEIIDREIHRNYRLHPVNYAALEMLEDTQSDESTPEAKAYLETRIAQLTGDDSGAGRRYFLGMYANPLLNAKAAIS